ncbi:TM2 [Sulfurimonas denitrificans DSM 1251]|jgi:TM2 domain-containing membrane protein YozV|uniref:TM2 n=1 Tax=Sulfurimonas denitrificans (strain ATCC 33889 / DSM 1251) TaxID=326298 RepID=Q30PH0_SULDN|nr:TM2 domain-containing protein [Sulfurimonas denitrificans]ABB45111.1 TM2 [Sulfurimonas denitrificans DSM 1251]MDD3442129.1 TM2 domain-containing protein [Sulfurimonas denitrificans]
MKGKILDFNTQSSSGVISADDGNRYNFNTSEWKSEKSPKVNQIVDFAISAENATAIYLDRSVSFVEAKSKIAAALLAFFLGAFGIHKFYLGCNSAGVIMLVLFLVGFVLLGLPSLIIGLIAFIESIIYIVKSDEDFQRVYVDNKKCWF